MKKIGSDDFTWGGLHYLITVDYHRNFFEIDKLKSTTSKPVNLKLKAHFANQGTPDLLVSENGPKYVSYTFKKFAKNWHFNHMTISAGNSQANGAADTAVKIAKRLL